MVDVGIDEDYEPSPRGWVREQVEEYEASGGTRANTLLDTAGPIILMTTVGHKSGKGPRLGSARSRDTTPTEEAA